LVRGFLFEASKVELNCSPPLNVFDLSPLYGSGLEAMDFPIQIFGQTTGLGAKSPRDCTQVWKIYSRVLGIYPAQGMGE